MNMSSAAIPFGDHTLRLFAVARRGAGRDALQSLVLAAETKLVNAGAFTAVRVVVISQDEEASRILSNLIERTFGSPRLPIDILSMLPLEADNCVAPTYILLVWATDASAIDLKRPAAGTLVIQGATASLAIVGADEGASGGPSPFEDLFHRMEERLEVCGFQFTDIVRSLTLFGTGSGLSSDEAFFQTFNLARQAFFRDKAFTAIKPASGMVGFPANTGIEVTSQTSRLGCIAVRCTDKRHLVEIRNPLQVAPASYRADVSRAAPLFSRAVALVGAQDALIFVSGTASVVGANTAHIGSARAQCEQLATILTSLLSTQNLSDNRAVPSHVSTCRVAYALVFIKRASDLAVAKEIIGNLVSPATPVVYAETRLCREDLLVEVELVASASWAVSSNEMAATALPLQ